MADTEDVIQAAVNDARDEGLIGVQEGDEPVVESTVAVVEPPVVDETKVVDEARVPTETLPEEKVAAEEDPLAKELGPEKRADGKENRIPYSNVQKIVKNAETRVLESIAKAAGVTFDSKTQTAGDVVTALSTAVKDLPALRSEIENVRLAEEVLKSDGNRFIRLLALQHPEQYGPIVALMDGKTSPVTTPEVKVKDVLEGMPEPNFDLPDGGKTYDLSGIQGLIKWAITKGAEQAKTEMAPALKPFEDARAVAEYEAKMVPILEAQYVQLQALEGFTEHEEAITKLLQEDSAEAARTKTRPKLTVEGAYNKIVIPKLTAKIAELGGSATTMRAKILKELQDAAVSTTVTTNTAVKTPEVAQGPRSTEDVIMEAVAAAKASGLK